MPPTRDRVVIDTNLWISFLLTKTHSRLDRLFIDQALTLLFSQELLDEFIEVAGRPKFKKYFSLADLEDLLTQIRFQAEFIQVTSIVDRCRYRDPKTTFCYPFQPMARQHTLSRATRICLSWDSLAIRSSCLSQTICRTNEHYQYEKHDRIGSYVIVTLKSFSRPLKNMEDSVRA